VRIIGHAGLAADRFHGTPDRARLERAAELGLDRLELDVCHSADGILVARHDRRVEVRNIRGAELLAARHAESAEPAGVAPPPQGIPPGTPVAELPLAELRALDPGLLSLDEAVAVLGGRVPLLLDLKVPTAAPLIARWLRKRGDAADFAVCTRDLEALREVAAEAPRAGCWPTLPEFGRGRRDYVGRALVSLWSTHQHAGRVRESLEELRRAVRDLRRSPQHILAAVAVLPWRWRLPDLAVAWSREVRAAGLCVPHWLITPEFCETASRLRLPLTAFTVNEAWAVRRVVGCGVTAVTTDDPVGVSRLLSGWGRAAATPAPVRVSVA
jgi:glycerophosphoryl diester phosphodiesterase